MKKIITILLIGALISLFIGAALFLSCWIVIILFIALLFIVTNLIWRLLPLSIRRIFKNSRMRFVRIILVCLIFFFFGGIAFNHWLLPQRMFHPISLLADAGILVFTIFLGWCLIKPRKKRVLSIGTIIFILFISSLPIIASKNQRYIMPSSIEQLKSLPYLTWVPAEKNIEKIGVTKYKHSLSYEGLNIYNCDGSPVAYLIDMSGKILHTWSGRTKRWQYVKMCNNGDLLGILCDGNLIRLDWDSNVRWKKKMTAHHDIAIAKNKDIYTLTKKGEIVFNHGLLVAIINDYITVLSPDGKIKKEISFYKILKKEISSDRFTQLYHYQWKQWKSKFTSWKLALSSAKEILKPVALKLICIRTDFLSCLSLDNTVFYTNAVKIIDRDIKGLSKEGNLLVCFRNLKLIGIVDIENEKLIWSWGSGNLDFPHCPTLLKNGNILIFDNGSDRGYSRIVELNPLTKNIVWEYKSNPPDQFYSKYRGASQQLPNGNILITESDTGHVFEITHDGEIVWEFYSLGVHIIEGKAKREAIYRMVRIIDTENYPFLKELK
ncbi:MAG: hypothetical protein ISS45_06570 [Candidatus Omnitrophica bacterium]|nr:hypothetical protein [Candidatus Omnitrophota bacterium]